MPKGRLHFSAPGPENERLLRRAARSVRHSS